MGPFPKVEVGSILADRYVLERVIGEGGMGIVFAARHRELNEIVAIKVLTTPSSALSLDDEALERFLREARLAAKIKNEHVVRVIDVSRGDGASMPPYIVMEYLEGVDLADLVASQGPLPVTEAVDYLLQACEALAEAHHLGIVHRDLKPSNLHLTRRLNGTPLLKVLDFGISKAVEEDDVKLTTTRSVFGSPAYMSPEQIRSAKHVDVRTDIWALAVVLFELLTGRLPFTGDSSASVLAAVSADAPLSLMQHAKHAVPALLEEVVVACLVKDRERRVADVRQLAAMLAPFGSAAGQASAEVVSLASYIPPPARSHLLTPLVGHPVARGEAQLNPTVLTPRAAGSETQAAGVRTDRAFVVNSQHLRRRAPVLAGVAFVVISGLVGITFYSLQRAHVKDPNAMVDASEGVAAATTATALPVASIPSSSSPEVPPSSVVAVVPPVESAAPVSSAHGAAGASSHNPKHRLPPKQQPPNPPNPPNTTTTTPTPTPTPTASIHVDFGPRQ